MRIERAGKKVEWKVEKEGIENRTREGVISFSISGEKGNFRESIPTVILYLTAGCVPLWWSSDSGLKNKQLKRKEKKWMTKANNFLKTSNKSQPRK